MPNPVPSPLAENAGLAFVGEPPWPPSVVTAAQCRALEADRNPTGRPNSDVLCHFVGLKSGRIHRRCQVDFPPHCTEQEAALYLGPYRHLRSGLLDFTGQWWINPRRQPALRTAIARLERYLAAPLPAADPVWEWVDSNLLPDASLLVVARDDDFTHGVLRSRLFHVWCRAHRPQLSAQMSVATFPFPWPPATLLNALTREQEEKRLALARAARGTGPDALNSAAAAAYGWTSERSDDELLARLNELNRQRAPVGF